MKNLKASNQHNAVKEKTSLFTALTIYLLSALSVTTAQADGDIMRFTLKNEAGFCVSKIMFSESDGTEVNEDKTNFCAGGQSRVKYGEIPHNKNYDSNSNIPIYHAKFRIVGGENASFHCDEIGVLTSEDGAIIGYVQGSDNLTHDEVYNGNPEYFNPKNNYQMVTFVMEITGDIFVPKCKLKTVNRRYESDR